MKGLPRRRRAGLALACLAATATGLEAQTVTRWSFRVEAGRAEIHRTTSTGGIYIGTLSREVGRSGILRFEGGLTLSGADEGFAALSAGVELRPLPEARITPYGKANAGLMWEPEYAGSIYTATVGLLLRVGDRTRILGAITRGTHGETYGPHSFSFGLERGFGPPRRR